MIWIGYTTLYREGGPKFERAALTLKREKAERFSHVWCERVETKREFVNAMAKLAAAGHAIEELHFFGHSGMYGPMFRTSSMPEQFSPHEWRTLSLPFAANARAYFHACRTARWFAPFFAQTFGVTAYGYHGYTTVSASPDRFRWEPFARSKKPPLYMIACPGKKSHGVWGSLFKYSGVARAEKMKAFAPAEVDDDRTYDSVADLYAETLHDISVRTDEWRWLDRHLPRTPTLRVLDIGCGNGALLRRLSSTIGRGVGVDRSTNMIARATSESGGHGNLEFRAIESPELPFDDHSFDVVISLLSFRYLDWDPIMQEIRRVLAPAGRVLIVDMVEAPLATKEWPRFLYGKALETSRKLRRPRFAKALRTMVDDPNWKRMVARNPIRAKHEMTWYLESRFPGRRTEVINVGAHAQILAFDSGPLAPGWVAPQSYP